MAKLLGEPHNRSLCAIAMGEAIAKMTELEVVGRPGEPVTVHCSCGCVRCRHGLRDRFGMNLNKERLKIRARVGSQAATTRSAGGSP